MKPIIVCSILFFAAQSRTAPLRELTIPVGKDPRVVAILDLNHDDKPDIVVTNGVGTLTVLLGNGRGQFHPAPGSPFDTGPEPNDIGTADFDGDRNIDLIVPNHATPYVTILLGDGKGAFRPLHVRTDSYPHPHGVAVADFDADGNPDVAIDSWGRNQIQLLRGDGHGGLLTPAALFNVGPRPYQRLRTADFNKDGFADLVTTNLDGGTVTVLLGDGHGSFRQSAGSPFAAGSHPWAVAIDDFNLDGNLDLVTIPYDRDITDSDLVVATILSGDGKGGFTPTARLALTGCHQPNQLATGDLNADRRPDIVVTCAKSGNVMTFLSTNDGGFQPSIRPAHGRPEGVAIGDLDGDGKNDVVIANGAGGTISVLLTRAIN